MAKKLGVVAAVLGVVLVGFLVAVAMQPATFRIERSVAIAASPAVIWSELSDFQKWPQWSPWEKYDPNQKHTYEGAAGQVGASTSWKGNDQVGSGQMTIAEAKPGEVLGIQLEFVEPFPSKSKVDFVLEPAGEATKVRWIMNGENNFLAKAFSMVVDMDAMLGKDFDEGLAGLKKVSEAAAKVAAEKAAAEKAAAPATE